MKQRSAFKSACTITAVQHGEVVNSETGKAHYGAWHGHFSRMHLAKAFFGRTPLDGSIVAFVICVLVLLLHISCRMVKAANVATS